MHNRLRCRSTAEVQRVSDFFLRGTKRTGWTQYTRPLLDLGDERLRYMDDAGIDMQVLSITAPTTTATAISTGFPVGATPGNNQSIAVVLVKLIAISSTI